MILKIERGSSRSHSAENSLWERLWTCHKTGFIIECMAKFTFFFQRNGRRISNTPKPRARISSVNIVTSLRAGRQVIHVSIPDRGKRYLSSPRQPTQPPVQWVPGILTRGPGRKPNHLPPSSTDVTRHEDIFHWHSCHIVRFLILARSQLYLLT